MMGNQIWSLGSKADFPPPLHIDMQYQEDMRGSEDDSFISSSEDLDQNWSFQEVLTRKKAEERREIKYNWTILQKNNPPQEGYSR